MLFSIFAFYLIFIFLVEKAIGFYGVNMHCSVWDVLSYVDLVFFHSPEHRPIYYHRTSSIEETKRFNTKTRFRVLIKVISQCLKSQIGPVAHLRYQISEVGVTHPPTRSKGPV